MNMEEKTQTVSTWLGRPMTELTRDELLEVVEWCVNEIESLRKDRSRWKDSADVVKYLMTEKAA